MIQHLIPIAQIAIRFENVPLSISVISVDGVVVVVESLRARVPAADVRLEAVLVLGQVGALRALDRGSNSIDNILAGVQLLKFRFDARDHPYP